MKQLRVVIVHGAYGSPEENWFPWLKQELEGLGHEVIVPRFPTPEGQQVGKWLQILDQEVGEYSSNLVMVGHSLGPALILRKLEQLEEPIRAAFLVSVFVGELGLPDFDPINANFFDKPFDWEEIRHNCQEFFIYNGDNDPYVPLEQGREMARRLKTELNVVHDAGHINAAAGYDKFERLLADIKSLS
jgi:predicted alpha/beta hydrolase family esterase